MKKKRNHRMVSAGPRAGRVYLVGAGPGDPGLITLKGRRALQMADVILYDYLANPSLLEFTKELAEKIYVGKKGNYRLTEQRTIEKMMIRKARLGKIVVRLKGGDPFVFGRGGEEALALVKAKIPFEVIPGVSSAIAVPAYAGIPVTHRHLSSSLAIVTGHEADKGKKKTLPWKSLAGLDSLVFLMGTSQLEQNMISLKSAGKQSFTPAAIISWGTYGKQRVIKGTIGDLARKVKKAALKPPAVVVVGEVTNLRESLNWFETKPLFGRKILTTRSRAQASDLSDRLREVGAEVIELPTIEVQKPRSYKSMDQAVKSIGTYDWILFTSANAVESFRDRLNASGKDVRDMIQTKIAAIGPGTALKLKSHGFWVDMMAREHSGSGLFRQMKEAGIRKAKILLPRAKRGSEELIHSLKKMGNKIDLVEAYETVIPKQNESFLERVRKESVDWILFTSSSTVNNLFDILGRREVLNLAQSAQIACIGPVTRKTAQEQGLRVSAMPRESTIPQLVGEIIRRS